jgi:hypothetical protein
MKAATVNKLILFLKVFIFNLLATVSLFAHAEYYQVYNAPEPSELCIYCQHPHRTLHHQRHRVAHHKSYHRSYGIYVYRAKKVHPACACSTVWTLGYCNCCPAQVRKPRTQWGDYVVFSSKPVDMYRNTQDEAPGIDEDQRTTDDKSPDLELN